MGEIPGADPDGAVFRGVGDLPQELPQAFRGFFIPLQMETAVHHKQTVVGKTDDVEHTAVGGFGSHVVIGIVIKTVLVKRGLFRTIGLVAESGGGNIVRLFRDPDLAPFGAVAHMVVLTLGFVGEEPVVSDLIFQVTGVSSGLQIQNVLLVVCFGDAGDDLDPGIFRGRAIPVVGDDGACVVKAFYDPAVFRGRATEDPGVLCVHSVPPVHLCPSGHFLGKV